MLDELRERNATCRVQVVFLKSEAQTDATINVA
jgi:hypothetical protein